MFVILNNKKEVFEINIGRKILIHVKTSIKFVVLIVLSAFIICGTAAYVYKPTYSVQLNGEFVGYTADKANLQKRVNEYLDGNGEENVAFIKLDAPLEYKLCLLKKNIVMNDDEIYDKVTANGIKYYQYFALTTSSEEKYYVKTFDEAETVVNQLKEKDSNNKDSLGIVEKYETSLPEFKDTETCVAGLYEKKVVKVTKSSTTSYAKGRSSVKYDLGVAFINPTSGIITSRYGIRSRDNHSGIDIAASSGTPIYAAAGGTVSVASYGYGGGYGNHIIIDHGNGVQTLYGHCRALHVSVGEYVSQGEYIAEMGTTGLSTGNHLHFEIRYNGSTVDPQYYTY